MFNIGIITFHESDNYGTCLQAYAMTQIIENLGYSAKIIPYSRIMDTKKVNHTVIEYVQYVLKVYGIRNLCLRKTIQNAYDLRKSLFENFRRSRLVYGDGEFTDFKELEKSEFTYDAYVCGSDMIWSHDRVDDLSVYFLQFVKKGKRIAFSPSFGSSTLRGYSELELKKYISEMDFLSCREQSGIEIIKKFTDSNVVHTADPTLLLKPSDWNKVSKDICLGRKYILVYLFEGIPTWAKNVVDDIAQNMNVDIIEIPMTIKQYANNIRKKIQPIGPEEFVGVIKNAEFVITNSYHGLMFSLIFRKPFYVLERDNHSEWGRYEDRLLSALRHFHCEDRYLTEKEKTLINLKVTMDYTKIENSIEALVNTSTHYLEEVLKEATRTVENYD